MIGLLPIAKKNNEDIQFEGLPVSQTLVNDLYDHLIPAFNQMGLGENRIIKIAPVDDQGALKKKRKTATGISLGVDSFYSIKKMKESVSNPVLLTFIYSQGIDGTAKSCSSLEFAQKESCAAQMNLELIPVVSNIRSILEKEFAFEQIHTFCHLSYVMFLSNGIDKYLYASGYSDKDSKLSLKDSSYYDGIIARTIQYPGFSMVLSGADVRRTEKTDYIKNDHIVQHSLSVCLTPSYDNKSVNCSHCGKCIRTMTTLDLLGALDMFSEQFDVVFYKRNKAKCWGDVLYRKTIMHDPLANEIIQEVTRRNFKLPIAMYYYFVKQGVINQMRKFRRSE